MAAQALALIAALTIATTSASDPAEARKAHRHRPVQAAPDVTAYEDDARLPIPYGRSFYPEDVEGGVSGNLPFNNQIRKFVDPLNANGGGG